MKEVLAAGWSYLRIPRKGHLSVQNNLYLGTATVIGFIFFLLVCLGYSSHHIASHEKAYTTLNQAVSALSNLHTTMHEYLLWDTGNYGALWREKFHAVEQRLNEAFDMPPLKAHRAEILDDFSEIETIFERLSAAKEGRGKLFDQITLEERRLGLELVQRLEETRAEITDLLGDAHSGLHQAQTIRVATSVTILLGVLGFAVIILFVSLVNNFNQRVRALIHGTKVFGDGNFDHRISEEGGKELGQLARAFNLMADRLKRILVSRDALSYEIQERAKAERALRESEAQARLILSMNPAPMWIFDRQTFKFIEVNDAAVRKYGYGREEFLTIEVTQIRPPEDASKPVEGRHRLKDGTLIDVSIESTDLDYDGRPAQLVLVHDITAHKTAERALRESEERFRRLSEAAFEALIVHRDEIIVEVNRAFYELFGYVPGEATGMNCLDLVAPGFRDWVREKIRAGDESPYEMQMLRKDGRCIDVEVRARAIPYEGATARVATINDISERKKSERELQKTASDLVRSNRDLEQFAYVASHDLQEPLRMIASYLDLLARKYRGQIDPNADEFIHFAVDGAKRMKRLIDDLLTYSRVGRIARSFELVDTEFLVDRVRRNLRFSLEESGAKIIADHLPKVYGDPVQLEQLFQNLVSNAIKFRSERPPEITISALRYGEGWEFSVADNGIGIEMQYNERIFLIFQRLHTASAYPGTGIGLAICKKIVERHGGKIWVRSVFGQGSAFHFRIADQISFEHRSAVF